MTTPTAKCFEIGLHKAYRERQVDLPSYTLAKNITLTCWVTYMCFMFLCYVLFIGIN